MLGGRGTIPQGPGADTNPEAQRRFVAEMAQQLGVEVVGVAEPRAAVVDSDIVVTSGPAQGCPSHRDLWLSSHIRRRKTQMNLGN